ncbi:MAG: hypothetical protein KGJ37_04615 [Verrucomicrobiota bacterium]|nr:hypothetical protein [Verrucomicrobiota bacterium]
MNTLRREIHPEIKVLDEKKGLLEYVASDETIDSYGEIVHAAGADFSRFQKNAPFVDSHDYSSIEKLLGKVVDFAVRGARVVETVQWAVDVPENFAAQKGFAMAAAGYLKAVSIGFIPLEYATPFDRATDWQSALELVGQAKDSAVRCIYTKWLQLELSACVIGANANAVARAYKAGILNDADLEKISTERARIETASSTDGPAAVELARRRAKTAFLVEFQTKLKTI